MVVRARNLCCGGRLRSRRHGKRQPADAVARLSRPCERYWSAPRYRPTLRRCGTGAVRAGDRTPARPGSGRPGDERKPRRGKSAGRGATERDAPGTRNIGSPQRELAGAVGVVAAAVTDSATLWMHLTDGAVWVRHGEQVSRLPAGVYAMDAGLAFGETALAAGAADPQNLEPNPLRFVADSHLVLGSGVVDVATVLTELFRYAAACVGAGGGAGGGRGVGGAEGAAGGGGGGGPSCGRPAARGAACGRRSRASRG